MIVLQTIAVAFAMFSRIPMPQFSWNDKNMKYALVAFPLIGVVIGGACYGVGSLCNWLEIPSLIRGLLLSSIPFVITGGIHLDGYMDTMDALCSHKSRDEKLEILKDPHIGSFAVCHLVFLLLWNVVLWKSWTKLQWCWMLLLFPFSRCLSGLAVCCFPLAKDTGLAHAFASEAVKGNARKVLFAMSMVLTLGFLITGMYGIGFVLIGWSMFGFYYVFAKKQFGGITGDLAGWFLTLAETLLLAWGVVVEYLLHWM